MKIHFDKAYLKLTLFYVLIVMVISVAFSVVLYQLSTREIQRGLRGQGVMIHDINSGFFEEFQTLRQVQLENSKKALREKLIYFNLLILIASAVLSYYLAKKSIEPLEEMVLAQKRFVADASHELKTPLTAMKTEIDVVMRHNSLKIEDAKAVLKSNAEEIDKLKKLSNTLLKLSYYEEDYQKTFKTLGLKKVLEDVAASIKPILERKNIKIRKEVADISIKADKDSISELFYIILENAVKYSPKKSTIKISAKEVGKRVKVTIEDRGCGIKSSDLPHIFDRFYRADHSRSKQNYQGYGLGLSIAKKIVDMHDGEIVAKSTPGEGTSFVITI